MVSIDYASSRYLNRLETYRQRHNSNVKRYATSSRKEIEEQLSETAELYKRWLESRKNGSKNRNGYSKRNRMIVKTGVKKTNSKTTNEKLPPCNIVNTKIDDLKDNTLTDGCLDMQYDDAFWSEIDKTRDIPLDILEQINKNESTISPTMNLSHKQFDISAESISKIHMTNSPLSRQQVSRNLHFDNNLPTHLNNTLMLPSYDTVIQNKTEMMNYEKRMPMLPASNFIQQQRPAVNSPMNMQYKAQLQHMPCNLYHLDSSEGAYTINGRKMYSEDEQIWLQSTGVPLQNNQNRSTLSSGLQYNSMNKANQIENIQQNVYVNGARGNQTAWSVNQFNANSTYQQQALQNQNVIHSGVHPVDVQMLVDPNYSNVNFYGNHAKSLNEGSQYVDMNNIRLMQNSGQMCHDWDSYNKSFFPH